MQIRVKASRWVGIVATLLLALVACSEEGPNWFDGGILVPGGTVFHRSGAMLTAQVGSIDISVRVYIEEADPLVLETLPAPLESIGSPYHYSVEHLLSAVPELPLLVGLPVPDGIEPTNLKIAIFEDEPVLINLEFPLILEEGAQQVSAQLPALVVLPTAYDAGTNLLFAPVHSLGIRGWTATIVRDSEFETVLAVSGDRSELGPRQLTPASTHDVEAYCSSTFEGAIENCGALDIVAAAAMLEDAYEDLTALGFTTTPRLARGIGTLIVINSDPNNPNVELIPGPYQLELRPSSLNPNVGVMYSISTGHIWLAVGVAGVTEARRSTVRHEYVHATQYGYDPAPDPVSWLNTRWTVEGQAVFLQGGYELPVRENDHPPRAMNHPLERSAWDNVSFTMPLSEYHAQDFWFYLASRFGHTSPEFLLPFMEQGTRTTDVDAVLRSEYAPAFGGSGIDGGLPLAYWEWAKNHIFEKQVASGSPAHFGGQCAFTAGSVDPLITRVITPGATTTLESFTLPPLTTQVLRVTMPGNGEEPLAYGATITVNTGTSAFTRSTIYDVNDAASGNCLGQADAKVRTATVGEHTQQYFVVVSNTSLVDEATVRIDVSP